MPQHCQTVRTGKTSWPCPNHGNRFAGRRGAFEGVITRFHNDISRIALQATDLDRFAFGGFANASFLAQSLGRTNAGTHTT
jgi:hypothetical protein